MLKGLTELLKKHKEDEKMTDEAFESELNKLLPETWKPASVYNELNEKYKLLESQKAESDKLLKEATEEKEASKDLKAKYDELLKTQKAEKEKYEKDLLASKKSYAIDLALTKAGAKNNKAVKALLDDSKIVLSDKDELVGFTEQLDAIKKDNDYLFNAKEDTDKPQNQPNPKPTFGGNNPNPSGNKNNGADDALRRAFGLF